MAAGNSIAQILRTLPLEMELIESPTSCSRRTHDASVTPTTCSLFRLPRELRNIIYAYYVTEPDGLVYNSRTRNLTKANGDRIDLAFVYTCRLAKKELSGLSLTLNEITFRTSFSEDARQYAGMFHAAITQFNLYKAIILNKLASRLLTEKLAENIRLHFPQLGPILEEWREGEDVTGFRASKDWGETPSVYRDFIQFSLALLGKQPGFTSESDRVSGFTTQKVQDFINFNPEPWSIPKREDLEKLLLVTSILPEIPWYHRNIEYTFSAASNAILFLKSLSSTSVQHLRNIVLIEGRESVAHPECHTRGLIPFCQANAGLRVRRYANLWTNVLPVRSRASFARGDPTEGARLYAKNITKAVARWMLEAATTASLISPGGLCTLTLDGNPVSEEASKVFTIVLRDAAWQSALDQCYACGSLPPPSWFVRRRRLGYMYEELPRILRELHSNTGNAIRCNFTLEHGHSAESIIQACEGYTMDEWRDAWSRHTPTSFQTVPPLPRWHILRAGNVIPVGY